MPARVKEGLQQRCWREGAGVEGGGQGGLVPVCVQGCCPGPRPRAGLSHHPGHPRATWHGLVGRGDRGVP